MVAVHETMLDPQMYAHTSKPDSYTRPWPCMRCKVTMGSGPPASFAFSRKASLASSRSSILDDLCESFCGCCAPLPRAPALPRPPRPRPRPPLLPRPPGISASKQVSAKVCLLVQTHDLPIGCPTAGRRGLQVYSRRLVALQHQDTFKYCTILFAVNASTAGIAVKVTQTVSAVAACHPEELARIHHFVKCSRSTETPQLPIAPSLSLGQHGMAASTHVALIGTGSRVHRTLISRPQAWHRTGACRKCCPVPHLRSASVRSAASLSQRPAAQTHAVSGHSASRC